MLNKMCVNSNIKKKVFIYSLFILPVIVVIIGFSFYLTKVNFCDDITLHFNFKKNDNSIQLYVITPTGGKINIRKTENDLFLIKGYYNSIYFSGTNKNIVDNIDLIVLKINDKLININRDSFFKYWEAQNGQEGLVCYSLNTKVASNNWFNKAISILQQSAQVVFICLLVLAFILYFYFYRKCKDLLSRFSNITTTKVILFCSILLFIYAIVFAFVFKPTDTVEIQGDYPVYQSEAVSLINGCDLKNQTIFDKYKFDKTNVDSVKFHILLNNYKLNNITWVPPVYPIFLSIIYKIFGVSPLIARYIQLLLLIFVASFLPLLLFLRWNFKGFFIGLLTGLIFIVTYYNISKEIMTEPLMIFFSFLSLFSITYFELKKSVFSAILLGITLAIALLVKGIIVFFILFYFIYLFVRFIRNKNKIDLRRLIIMFVVFFISLFSWITYSNLNDGLIQRAKASKQELSEISDRIKDAFNNKANPSIKEINFDSIIKINKTLSTYFPGKEIPFFNTVTNDTTKIDQSTKEGLIDMSREITKEIADLLNSPCYKLGDRDYIYLNKKKLVIISINHTLEILESNYEKCTDGNIHPNDFIKQTYDSNYNSSSFIRVLNFYYSHPRLIPIIFPNKLYAGYHNFLFFLLLMALIISDFILLLINKNLAELKNFKKIIPGLLVPIFLFCANYNLVGFMFCFVLAFIVICVSLVRRKSLILFNLPLSFNLFILNFILITFIFFGSDRITSILDFVFIISAVYYLFEYYNRIFGRKYISDI